MNTKRKCTISHLIDSGAAFAVDIETGESVHMRPQIVKSQSITADDIGEIFEAWVMPVSDRSAHNVSAFIGWVDDDDSDEVQKLRQQLTDARKELLAAQGKLDMIRKLTVDDALERGPVAQAV